MQAQKKCYTRQQKYISESKQTPVEEQNDGKKCEKDAKSNET